MAETKNTKLEREYTIPLRKFWLRVPEYARTGKAMKAIKQFIAKHMKVTDRDVSLVKVDVQFNNEFWYRGKRSPPSKVTVKAIKNEDGTVRVTFVEVPKHVEFAMKKHAARHQKADKKPAAAEEKKEEKTEAQKTDEKEKEAATAEQHAKEAKHDASVQKHMTKPQKTQHPQRMALQK